MDQIQWAELSYTWGTIEPIELRKQSKLNWVYSLVSGS